MDQKLPAVHATWAWNQCQECVHLQHSHVALTKKFCLVKSKVCEHLE